MKKLIIISFRDNFGAEETKNMGGDHGDGHGHHEFSREEFMKPREFHGVDKYAKPFLSSLVDYPVTWFRGKEL